MSVAVISLRWPFISESPPTPLADDGEDLAIAGSVCPLGVGEIGRAWILRRERAVAEPLWPVALPAGPHIRLATGGDRFRRGLNRILDRGRLRIAALGRLSEDRYGRGHERKARDNDRGDNAAQGLRSATHSTSLPAGPIQPSLTDPRMPALGVGSGPAQQERASPRFDCAVFRRANTSSGPARACNGEQGRCPPRRARNGPEFDLNRRTLETENPRCDPKR